MAKKVKPTLLKALIGDKNAAKMGNYKEATGGGTPLEPGEKLKDHPEAKRVMQPRDENGQFTYNSVNFKERKYDYHGKADTIPPFLKGVNLSYFVKRDSEINYNGMIHLAGIEMTASEIIDQVRTWREQGGFGKLETEIKGKVGRRSNENKGKMAVGKEGILKDDTEITPGKTKKDFVGKLQKALEDYKAKKVNEEVLKKQEKEGRVEKRLAKKNPQEFLNKYKEKIDKIKKIAPEITDELIIKLMNNDKFEGLDFIEEALKSKMKK